MKDKPKLKNVTYWTPASKPEGEIFDFHWQRKAWSLLEKRLPQQAKKILEKTTETGKPLVLVFIKLSSELQNRLLNSGYPDNQNIKRKESE